MALALKKAQIVLDTDLASLQAWIDSTTVNTIESVALLGEYLLILYT